MIIKISSHAPYRRKNGYKTDAKLLRLSIYPSISAFQLQLCIDTRYPDPFSTDSQLENVLVTLTIGDYNGKKSLRSRKVILGNVQVDHQK